MSEGPGTATSSGAARLLGFCSFFVFPAIPLGPSSGLAIPSVLAVLLGTVWFRRMTKLDWAPFAWMVAPLAISGAYALASGTALAPDVIPKLLAVLALAFVIVVPTCHLLRNGHFSSFAVGAALAVVVQALLGAYQVVAFDAAEFPYAEIMSTNPGMAMQADTMATYVEYVKRPFGLFAEPSAMAACVGPWLVVFSGALFESSLRGRFQGHRLILGAALASGLGLVGLSQSGQALPIAAASVWPAILAAYRSKRRWLLPPALIVGSLALILVVAAAAQRSDLAENESWQLRLASLTVALRSLAADGTFLLGVGPGQSVPHLESKPLGYLVSRDVSAIWSVTLTYAMETGAVGLAAMLVLGSLLARSIWASRARALGVATALVWLFGLAFGTSYAQQPALWTTMAMLLSWHRIAGDPEAERRPTT